MTEIPPWSVVETVTNQQVPFQANFRSTPNSQILQVYSLAFFSILGHLSESNEIGLASAILRA